MADLQVKNQVLIVHKVRSGLSMHFSYEYRLAQYSILKIELYFAWHH